MLVCNRYLFAVFYMVLYHSGILYHLVFFPHFPFTFVLCFSVSFVSFFFLLPTAHNLYRIHHSLFPLLAIWRGLFYQSLDPSTPEDDGDVFIEFSEHNSKSVP